MVLKPETLDTIVATNLVSLYIQLRVILLLTTPIARRHPL
jgi:hypothetical protein